MLTRSSLPTAISSRFLRPPAVALALIALSGAPALAQEEGVVAAPRFVEGEQWTYDLNLDLVVSQDESTTRLVQGATLDLFVADIAEDGRARLDVSVLALTNVWSDDVGQLEYAWSADAGQTPQDVSSPDEAFTDLARAIAEAEIAIIASPEGEILEIVGLANALEQIAENQRFGPRALGVFAPPQLAATLEPVFQADGLVGPERRPGQGWQSSETLAMGPAGRITFSVDFVVESIEDDVIAYTGEEFVEIERPAEPGETTPLVEVAEQDGSVQGRWSLENGVLNSRRATRRLATRWTLADLVVDQTQNSTITLERRTH